MKASRPGKSNAGDAAPAADDALTPAERDLLSEWRAMGSLWGISPTTAQVHGLLYLTGEALTADDIMARLGLSRGGVSMSLARLVEWGLVRRTHQRGDRRDRYESLPDVWEIFTRIAAERKRREVDPILSTLQRCREEMAGAKDPGARERLRRVQDLHAFLSLVDRLAQRFFESQKGLRAAVQLLSEEEPAGE